MVPQKAVQILVPPPEAMLMFKGHAAAGTRLIWVISTATQDHGDISARPQSGFMVQLHPGSVMMFVVHVTTDGYGRYGPHGLGAWELVLPLKGHFSGRTGPPSYWENWLQRFGVGKLWWPSENYIHIPDTANVCRRACPNLCHASREAGPDPEAWGWGWQ